MGTAFICEGVRTPIGRYGGALSAVRTDDLAAHPLVALRHRFEQSDWETVDEVLLGCVNQAGEDNRNVARMASLLAGIPHQVPAATVNRLCASGMEAVAVVARAITIGEISLAVAGGVESMSRAPLVMPKATSAFSRNAEIYDSTMGWRFVNPLMEKTYGIASMPETAENVAEVYGIDRASQDRFAFRSQKRAAAAQRAGVFAEEITAVNVPRTSISARTRPWTPSPNYPRLSERMGPSLPGMHPGSTMVLAPCSCLRRKPPRSSAWRLSPAWWARRPPAWSQD